MQTAEKRELIRSLYDPRSSRSEFRGGSYDGDFHGALKAVRENGAVHEGTIAANLGLPYHDYLSGYDENHFSCYDYASGFEGFRDNVTFSSDVYSLGEISRAKFQGSILEMGGVEHKRYRALVHPQFVRKYATWWIDTFIAGATERLIDEIEEQGRADLNLQLCNLLPLYTITASLGIGEDDALLFSDLNNKMNQLYPEPAGARRQISELLLPLVEARRSQPGDDLLSVLTQAELVDEQGPHSLDDEEILAFSRLLLTAGLSTTWRQLGILIYLVLSDPTVLAEVKQDPQALVATIEEMMRFEGTETIMRRHLTAPAVLGGVELPEGSVLEICIAAGNRDPERWDEPDTFDIHRPRKPTLSFGGGPHVCLGMHVARAEMMTAMTKIFERLPNLRLDPEVDEPRIIGFEGRGVEALHVLWDA